MELFPIKDLLKLQKEYAELKGDYDSLEEVFNETLNEMDFNRYYEDQEYYETYLLKFNHIEQELKLFKKMMDNLKLQLSN